MFLDKFHLFDQSEISDFSIPELFTFPFYYSPHPLADLASKKLQEYLISQKDFSHNFGLDSNDTSPALGKMFGVLVCKNTNGQLGYLWAFSGKLNSPNVPNSFVPPIFDVHHLDSFYKKEEIELNQINKEIEEIENDAMYLELKRTFENLSSLKKYEIAQEKLNLKARKLARDKNRDASSSIELLAKLDRESISDNLAFKKFKKNWETRIDEVLQLMTPYYQSIQMLKQKRKAKSAEVQKQIFESFVFLNAKNETKNIAEIYPETPPSGAGECAAPRLLHYAYSHNLHPICMAEFWWGISPKSEVRRHKSFYPACRKKCAPLLLGHMLKGLNVAPNPLETMLAAPLPIPIIYEDKHFLAIAKPPEILSVPGNLDVFSIYQWAKEKYPGATGPIIVHRLDMSTSGIMLLAKTEDAYHNLQQQFTERSIKKTYCALLDGKLIDNKGIIELPLRVDLEDRPRQLVCFNHGKKAITHWEKIAEIDGKTKVYFYPITGRTHQLRIHAAHSLGLNTPILGDDIYGRKEKRLYLQAVKIEFKHPNSGKSMILEMDEEF